ncbi:MAG: biopolymer transporter ExbD [Halobacteriovoraceae bacterium]|nr:biopolymer transporter ExbD [Halobacteriovoraceae bacterium]MCB9093573.1 biopolymer transporter ExbD [Halobacteriovoraceae bacterium]
MHLSQSLISGNLFEKRLISRKQKKDKFRKNVAIVLTLTSMVDVFSMLVVFLLQTFSSSPEILISKGVELPASHTAALIREAPVVAISHDGNIYLDQKEVGETGKVLRNPDVLLGKLNKIKLDWLKNHPGEDFTGDINLQADKATPSTTVSRLMGILTSGQFQSIKLAVIGSAVR